ncbi:MULTISPECIES: hypothetical protein [Rufibacter]|uniref:BRCT domain type II-containing protein n=1 Tax=Rufibacter quisquiliarum TaxID=1549639 RepID=A0A839GVS2_9BACT|nr:MULTISPECIES: hypothetical protein [Rufibacter]MBA9078528.1 BRCT domain type II-containing protein [Rufibacter quisquiliarum]
MENQTNQLPQADASQATSYDQDSANRTNASAQANGKGGMLDSITGSLSNIQVPQAVKDFGATCARTYNGLSTTQKVIGGAALALGAGYLAASKQGWVSQGKMALKNRKAGKNA